MNGELFRTEQEIGQELAVALQAVAGRGWRTINLQQLIVTVGLFRTEQEIGR